MFLSKRTTRRKIIKVGLASAAAATLITTPKSHAVDFDPKKYKKGEEEIKVVYLGGDQLHNGMGQMQGIRSALSKKGWRLLFTQDARYVTPEILSDTDLFIITRWGGAIESWCSEPFQEGSMPNDGYMSDELQNSIVDNVLNRGMGFMALHCTCWSPDYDKFNDMMGIKGIMHGPVQNVFLHNFNQDHPISQGIDDFFMPLDENFGVELTNPDAIKLFESTGADDKRHDIAGWCLENGNGRIVGLVAGHTYTSWRHETYRKMYRRGAHWALKLDVPKD